jgi:peroxin-4
LNIEEEELTKTLQITNMTSVKRLQSELRSAAKTRDAFFDCKEDVTVAPEGENALHTWYALIRGPVKTPFEGGVWRIKIKIPSAYPTVAPKMVFETPIIHPNIHLKTGEICIDILKDQWTPVWSLESACRAIVAMLSSPEADSPLNCDAGNMIRGRDLKGYHSLARMITVEYALDLDAMRKSFPELPAAAYAPKK